MLRKKGRLSMFYILLAIGWLGLLIYSVEEFLVSILYSFFFFGACVLIWGIWGFLNKDSSVFVMIGITFFSGVLWVIAAFMLNSYTENRTKEYGNNIVAAIESYRANTGGLPDTLSLLVPAHIPEVPTVRNRLREKHFDYKKIDSTNYSLSFDGHFLNSIVYRSDEEKWRKSD